MIEKIAAHIADFTPRLQSNTRATYQVHTSPTLPHASYLSYPTLLAHYTNCKPSPAVGILLTINCICIRSDDDSIFPFPQTAVPRGVQYCAMPVVQYKQLEDELFCNIYYLRHLCDTLRFPDWPIKEPVSPPSSLPSFLYTPTGVVYKTCVTEWPINAPLHTF